MSNNLIKKRDSNLELFRIITMLLIVAHHYVVNSDLLNIIMNSPFSLKSVYLLLFGAWGKIGINCFVLITGYFMCKSNITVKKFVKLLGEVMFYNIVIGLIFMISGYSEFSFSNFIKLFIPIKYISNNFTSCYLIFFLIIPFLNILIQNLNERKHLKLLCICAFTYIFLGSVPFLSVTMNYISWFIVLYFISSYIRLYPKKIFSNTRFWFLICSASIIICSVSVICCFYYTIYPYYFVTDSNSFLAVITGLSLFMLFKNLKISYNRFINIVAASTFGVLLIHANCNEMREWLWNNICSNAEMFASSLIYIHSIICVIIIFTICTIIDYLRIHLVEKPFLSFWDKIYPRVSSGVKFLGNRLCNKLHIK